MSEQLDHTSRESSPSGPRTPDPAPARPNEAVVSENKSGTAPNDSDDLLALDALEGKVVDILKTVYDPEIPVDIYELGLVYDVEVDSNGTVEIEMTLTSPACPVAGSLPAEVEFKVGAIPEVKDVRVNLVWDPPWTPDRMSEAAKLELNMW